jgi:hypothetical protein
MALSDKWTRAQLRAVVRRELLDPNGRWWGDTELNSYLDDWQSAVQDELEMVWGTATATLVAGTATATITAIATDILRVDRVYFNGTLLTPTTVGQLDDEDWGWRSEGSGTPRVVYFERPDILSVHPKPDTDGLLYFEYPKALTFATDTATSQLPPWVRYSAANYCAYRAYLRSGPNHDLQRALRRKAKLARQIARYRTLKVNILPERFPKLTPTA